MDQAPPSKFAQFRTLLNSPELEFIMEAHNGLSATTGEAASLACAIERLKGDAVIAYGDILFRQYYLDRLLAAEGDIVVAVDELWESRHVRDGAVRDFVQCSRPFSGDYLDDEPVTLARMTNDVTADGIDGEWIGLARLSAKGAGRVAAELKAMRADGTLPKASLLELFTRLALAGDAVRVLYVPGQWMDVDDAADLAAAGRFL
jgi:phosphoenolpyruvate phosphomutase